MNLFLVHTPFQLFVAQMIIKQYRLVNNILVEGFVNNGSIYNSYDLIIDKNFFKKILIFDDVNVWAQIEWNKLKDLNPFKLFKNIITRILLFNKGIRFYKRLFKTEAVDSVYLGDINNTTCKFTALFLQKKYHVKVNFFEDGTSHYFFSDNSYKIKYNKNILISFFDIFMYYPFSGIYFAKYLFDETLKWDKLPIDKRFSVVPFYKEKYDVLLTGMIPISPNLKKYIERETLSLNIAHETSNMLILSSCIYEIKPEALPIYVGLLKSLIHENKNSNIIIKFHPREWKEVVNDIVSYLQTNNYRYAIISKDVAIPTEYYLNYITFDTVYNVFTSSSIYNGYLYPKQNLIDISDIFFKRCQLAGFDMSQQIHNINQIKTNLNIISKHS